MNNTSPTVSFVMSVYNEADALNLTLDSMRQQSYAALEFIIINDGSTDGSDKILDEYAEMDRRFRIIHKPNSGLTQSLILGVSESSSTYIARHDAGDISEPGRIEEQVKFLTANSEYNAVSSYVSFYCEENEQLFQSHMSEQKLSRALTSTQPDVIMAPPHHGAAMYRRDSYLSVGGYRPEFYFAQDLDLWTRMAETGKHGMIQIPLYSAYVKPESISGLYTPEQEKLKNIVARAIDSRSILGHDDEELAMAALIKPMPEHSKNRARRLSAGCYFIGSCLLSRRPDIAQKYFMKSIKSYPVNVKAWVKFIWAKIKAGAPN